MLSPNTGGPDESALVAEALRLEKDGKSQRQIAAALGKPRHWVRYSLAVAPMPKKSPAATVAEVPLHLITANPHARAIDRGHVDALAGSVAEIGLLEPVVLRSFGDAFEVMAGLHRVEAFRKLGLQAIPAIVREADDLLAELVLIDENLCRHDLSPAERALAVKRRKAIYLQLHPETRPTTDGGEGRHKETRRQVGDESVVERFTQATAEVSGIGERTIQRDAARGEKLGEDVLKKVVGTSLDKGDELDALAKLSEKQREVLIKRAAAGEDVSAKRPVINGARALMGSRAEPDDSLDFFPTPPFVTRALAEHVLPHLGIDSRVDRGVLGLVWEPAAGEGHMSEVLKEYADHVFASDIFGYRFGQGVHDFLAQKMPSPILPDWIITNPPFGDNAVPFVLRALEIASTGVAMFVRLQFLEGIERYERIFRDHPPTLIGQFAERVPLCKGCWKPDGTTATAYCWLVWVKDRAPAPAQMFWIPPGCRVALTKPDDRARFAAWSLPSGGPSDEPADDSDAAEVEPAAAPRFLRRGRPECTIGAA
jgi:ParB-like chromosome segregation protein Spo0J